MSIDEIYTEEERRWLSYNSEKVRSIMKRNPAPDQPMNTAPTDGRRLRLFQNEKEHHGWWEDGFGCWMGMDADWNLLQLHPTGWSEL